MNEEFSPIILGIHLYLIPLDSVSGLGCQHNLNHVLPCYG